MAQSSGGKWTGKDYGAIISAVGSVAIGAFSAASGNKRAWAALNEKAKLAQQQQDFNQDLAITENYEDYYIKLQESQAAKEKLGLYTNSAGIVVIGLVAIGVAFLIKKFT